MESFLRVSRHRGVNGHRTFEGDGREGTVKGIRREGTERGFGKEGTEGQVPVGQRSIPDRSPGRSRDWVTVTAWKEPVVLTTGLYRSSLCPSGLRKDTPRQLSDQWDVLRRSGTDFSHTSTVQQRSH